MIMSLMLLFDSALLVVALVVGVIGTCVATYFLAKRRTLWEIEVIRAEVADRLAEALEEIELAKQHAAEPVRTPAPEAPKPVAVPKPAPPVVATAPPASDEIAHETLVVIAAAVAAFLGKSVRLRSARLIQPSAGSPWAQQGRVFVQASHNLGLAQRAHG